MKNVENNSLPKDSEFNMALSWLSAAAFAIASAVGLS